MVKKTTRVSAGVLLELANLITLSADSVQAATYEARKAATLSKEAARVLPQIPYSMFCEIEARLEQRGETFEAYLSGQIANLYFLLRLNPLVHTPITNGIDKHPKGVDDEGDKEVVDELFPKGVLEVTARASANQLLGNYLTESWNRYSQYGPPKNQREAQALSRMHYLVFEVVRSYGWWTWPFLHHFDSSVHVDAMLRLIEDAGDRPIEGRVPDLTGIE